MTYRKLTDRQALFAREYLIDLNATQAAIRAGYSRRSASQRGWALRRHPGVAARIDAVMDDRARLVGVTAERVLCELALLGFANIRDYFDADGGDGAGWRDPMALTREQAAAITELQLEEGGAGRRKVKIKLADKSRNLELIGRHLGLFPRAPSRDGARAGGETAEAGKDAVPELSDEDRAQEILRLLVVERKGG